MQLLKTHQTIQQLLQVFFIDSSEDPTKQYKVENSLRDERGLSMPQPSAFFETLEQALEDFESKKQ